MNSPASARSAVLLCAALLAAPSAWAVRCEIGEVTLGSQAAIDNFQASQGGGDSCTERKR